VFVYVFLYRNGTLSCHTSWVWDEGTINHPPTSTRKEKV
jgi:hypothetical protein